MRPRGDLGHHAAEPGVLVDAGGDLVGQQRHGAVGVQARDADTGFVARGFDRQDRRTARHNAIPPHRVSVGAADSVVAPAQAHLSESHAAVQRDRRLVVGADLQVNDATVGELQQLVQQPAADTPPLIRRVHADGVHLVLERRLPAQPRDPGVADQHVVRARADVMVVGAGQFAD